MSICNIGSNNCLSTPYEKKLCKNVIGIALITIGIAGIIWGVVSANQMPLVEWKLTVILTPSVLLTLLGTFVVVSTTNKKGDNMSIRSSYNEYRSNQSDTQRFNNEMKRHKDSSDTASKISKNIYHSSSDDSDSESSKTKTNRKAKEVFDIYPWNDDPKTLSDEVAKDRMYFLESYKGKGYPYQDKNSSSPYHARQRLILCKQLKDNEIAYKKEMETMQKLVKENTSTCSIL